MGHPKNVPEKPKEHYLSCLPGSFLGNLTLLVLSWPRNGRCSATPISGFKSSLISASCGTLSGLADPELEGSAEGGWVVRSQSERNDSQAIELFLSFTK